MEQKDYRLAAIMYTDIVGFSRMMGKDETGTLTLLRYHNDLVAEITERHHGTVIKTIGDAFLVDFKNTVEALQSALEIQDKLYEFNKTRPEMPLLLRIGLHLGDIYFFENDALGEGINIAARLQGLAHPGCICFSQDVYNQVINKVDFHADKLGKVSLKNITKEVHAFEIASGNVEFDPERDKPKAGYKSDAYAEPVAPPRNPRQPPVIDPERAKEAMGTIRTRILEDIKASGRRLSVDEVRPRYRDYGVEADEVIARLAEQGILQKGVPGPTTHLGSIAESILGPRGVEDLGKNIETAISSIVGAIETGTRQAREKRKPTQKELIAAKFKRHEKEVATGKWDAELRKNDQFKPGPEEALDEFEEYRSAALMRATKQRTAVIGSLSSAVATTAIVGAINYFTFGEGFVPGKFWWAAIVAAVSFGTFLTSWAAGRRAARKTRELEAMPTLETGQLELYKRANRVKDSFALHSASAVAVPLVCGVINFLTINAAIMTFPWAAIVAIASLFGWLSHGLTYRMTKPRVEKDFLRSVGHEGSWWSFFRGGKRTVKTAATLGRYAEYYQNASQARDAIVSQIESDGKRSPMEKETIPTLDSYVGQVLLLSQTVNEIDSIINAIPLQDLAKDKQVLLAKTEKTANQELKKDYGNSIEEIEKQERSYNDLLDQRERLELRLKSSVNSIKQMQLDLARLRSSPEANETSTLADVKRRTSELTKYIEDLRTGYIETHKDPFAELEELAKKEDERKRLAGDAGTQSKSQTP